MKPARFCLPVSFLLLISACSPSSSTPPQGTAPAVTPSATISPTVPPTSTPSETPTPLLTPTRVTIYPEGGYGPTGFPGNVDPLTGLAVGNPALLDRRPMAIKISNYPREIRPQWGLSQADIAFDYYTEAGATRFIALFYGNDAGMVGPIRSARFFDANIIDGYKAVFAFGGADIAILQSLEKSDFSNRMVVEGPSGPITRYDPNGLNLAVTDTSALSRFISQKGVDNVRQNLDGMFFLLPPPPDGQPVSRIYVRFSGISYNRWDYDPASGKYLRFEDISDDPNLGATEHYAALTDRLTGLPVAFDNVVVLYATNQFYRQATPGNNEIINIQLSGSGPAYAFRDGQAYRVTWHRESSDAVVSLTAAGGKPFPFKPGTTCFEVIGMASSLQQAEAGWRFTHHMP